MNRRKVEEGELNILMSFDQLSLFLCVASDSYVTARWYVVSCAWEVMRRNVRATPLELRPLAKHTDPPSSLQHFRTRDRV